MSPDNANFGTNEPDFGVLLKRLDRLEEQNRWLKRAGAIVVTLGCAAVLAGAAAPKKTLEAEEILLRGPNGETRAKLGMNDSGDAVRLSLLDRKGTPRAGLAVTNDGPILALMDENERVRTHIDSKGMSILSAKGDNQLLIFGGEDTGPVIEFFDRVGRRRVEFNLDARDGAPTLLLNGSDQTTRTLLVAGSEATLSLTGPVEVELTASAKVSSLGFFDTEKRSGGSLHPKGKPRMALKVDREDATVAMADSGQNAQAYIGVLPDGPHLGLIKNGRPSFEAPSQ